MARRPTVAPKSPAAVPRSSSLGKIDAQGQSSFLVVAIGASAGGLHATRELLKSLPKVTGCAFVLVQHLDPTHESMLPKLLLADTSLRVLEATDGMGVEPEHLYVIPPAFNLWVEDGSLRLARQDRPGARMPYDLLLTSLVAQYGRRTVAVVLSGTGNDGSSAVASVSGAGGLVIAQDPEEADFDGMPRSAIRSDVDALVLRTARMPHAILHHAENFSNGSPPLAQIDVAQPLLSKILALVRSTTGNDFSFYKPATLQRRIDKRMASLGFPPHLIDRYLALLEENADERRELAKEVLVNVTSFFRDGAVFEFLGETVIPQILSRNGNDDKLRIWIAGCSTGEEAYSLAMLFLEGINSLRLNTRLQVFASDADPDAVLTAREGYYDAESASAISPDRLQAFFIKDGSGYRVSAKLRDTVIFTVQNVLSDPPFSRIDLVSCRNLLIYLEPVAQAKALALFGFALRENGILVLGSAETVGKLSDGFTILSKSNHVYTRVGKHGAGEFLTTLGSSDNVRRPIYANKAAVTGRPDEMEEMVYQTLLARLSPAAVLVNRRYENLYSIGDTDRYLQVATGRASHNLFAMAPKSLHNKIRSAVHRATQDQKLFVSRGAKIHRNGEELGFSIQVEPLHYKDEQLFLISFYDDISPSTPAAFETLSPDDVTRSAQLERELEETRDDFQGAIRNLELAGEEQRIIMAEALSLNEEYQSTNEELMTSKEELQSLNEELTALNTLLHETLDRQRVVSNDLENVLYSTDVATLFLDAQLSIRFFTPATRLLINILPSDIGRPFSDLNALTNDETLKSDCLAVLHDGETIDREIGAFQDRWYVRRIKPYRVQDGAIEGVVITFLDTSVQKQIAEGREAAKKSAQKENQAKSQFLAAASHDLRQPLQTLKLLQGLLEKTVADDQSMALVKRMEEALGSMSGIINAVLNINQIEAGLIQPNFDHVAISDLLVRMQNEFLHIARAKNLELRVVQSSLAVYTDRGLLELIVRNLLSNALKYTLEGKVLLGCRRRGKTLRVEVWDSGIGIAENEIKHVFDEYRQVGTNGDDHDHGVGLGLSIVKRLGDFLGLQVSVCSTAGRGSVFALEIDLATGGESAARRPDQKPDMVPLQSTRSRILVVEDEHAVRDLLRLGLTQAGHIVVTARDGIEAMRVVRDDGFVPDLILADYNLPLRIDGLVVIENIRATVDRQMPALILSGDISTRAMRKYVQLRIPYLNKPVKLDEIVAKIAELLSAEVPRSPSVELHTALSDEQKAPVIEVIDDEASVRDSIRQYFEKSGSMVYAYASAEEYLAGYDPERGGCLLLDAYLPGMGGIDLLDALRARDHRTPIIVITGRSDVGMAVDAMKLGAADFIEKPFSYNALQRSVRAAIENARGAGARAGRREASRSMLAQLTARQRQVLDLILLGHPNKIIAAELGLSQRTVENHRASIMRRTGSVSLSGLLRLVVSAEE
ncbi:MAG: response regulator [Alphaproteobacteria bacterium]|nr:MAG: response regulator [Alphaproteobacteria bacterium]